MSGWMIGGAALAAALLCTLLMGLSLQRGGGHEPRSVVRPAKS